MMEIYVGEKFYNTETNRPVEILEYIEELEYGIIKQYRIRFLDTFEEEVLSKNYILFRFKSLRTINEEIDKYTSLINLYMDNISQLRWEYYNFQQLLKTLERKES